MSPVGTTSLLLSLINLDMGNVESVDIQAFHLGVSKELIEWGNIWHKLSIKVSIHKGHTSALLSAFLSKSRMNLADLTGQRPCPLECLFLAWAVLPTPPQNRRNGMACLCARTSSKYLLALTKGNFRIANAVSRVFCREHLKPNKIIRNYDPKTKTITNIWKLIFHG